MLLLFLKNKNSKGEFVMKVKRIICFMLMVLLVLAFVGCGNAGKKPNATNILVDTTNTPKPTATPKPTNTPDPTPSPTPDIDAEVDAILYRFAYEGEEIVDNMFGGIPLKPMNSTHEYTEEGLLITIEDVADPYFNVPLPDDMIDITKYTIFKMHFKSSSKATGGQLYFGYDGDSIQAGMNQARTFKAEATDDWQVIYMDFSEIKFEGAEVLTAFRADILGGSISNSTITVDYFGFFKSMEDAKSYIPPNRR